MEKLDKILQYQDQDITWRFTQHFNVSEAEASEIFVDLLKWMWLCATALNERKEGVEDIPPRLVIDKTTLIIDEMWHNFICFTEKYHNFCISNFGFYLHHYPTSKKANERILLEMVDNPTIQIDRRRQQYFYVLNKLGKDTLVKWYDVYAKKYTPETIKNLRIK